MLHPDSGFGRAVPNQDFAHFVLTREYLDSLLMWMMCMGHYARRRGPTSGPTSGPTRGPTSGPTSGPCSARQAGR